MRALWLHMSIRQIITTECAASSALPFSHLEQSQQPLRAKSECALCSHCTNAILKLNGKGKLVVVISSSATSERMCSYFRFDVQVVQQHFHFIQSTGKLSSKTCLEFFSINSNSRHGFRETVDSDCNLRRSTISQVQLLRPSTTSQ